MLTLSHSANVPPLLCKVKLSIVGAAASAELGAMAPSPAMTIAAAVKRLTALIGSPFPVPPSRYVRGLTESSRGGIPSPLAGSPGGGSSQVAIWAPTPARSPATARRCSRTSSTITRWGEAVMRTMNVRETSMAATVGRGAHRSLTAVHSSTPVDGGALWAYLRPMLTTARGGLIESAGVVTRIALALEQGSVLLVAGAGYGKTTALRQALERAGAVAAWVR